MKTFMVFGIMRVGNHAIINWIIQQLVQDNKSVLFDNDIQAGSQFQVDPIRPASNREVFGNQPYDYYIRSHEQIVPERATRHRDEARRIIIVRDPYNWLASSLGKGKEFAPHMVAEIKKWIDIYISNAMKWYDSSYPYHMVSYNEWFTSKEYRMQLAEALDIQFSDAGLNYLAWYNNGSSFDGGKEYRNRAQDMKVLER
jgi:hypothetical protein